MKITHEQRCTNVGSMLVSEIRQLCERHRKFFEEGVPLNADGGCPAAKVTPDELTNALGPTLTKEMLTVQEFVLDGKSNQITKPGAPEAVAEEPKNGTAPVESSPRVVAPRKR